MRPPAARAIRAPADALLAGDGQRHHVLKTTRDGRPRRERRPVASDRVSQLVEGLQHPWRREILSQLKRAGRASASEIATRLDVPVNGLSYHVRRLERLGLIHQVERVRRRGALMRVFELTPGLERTVATLLDEHLVVLANLAASGQVASIAADLDATALAELEAEFASMRATARGLEEATRARIVASPSPTEIVRVTLVAVMADRTERSAS